MTTLTRSEKVMLDIKDIAKRSKTRLKEKFPQCVFSVRIKRYSGGQSLDVSLMSAPFKVLEYPFDCNGNPIKQQYWQLNQYQFGRQDGLSTAERICNGAHLTQEAWDTMRGAWQIVEHFNFDESDIQKDYFCVNFYSHYEIGQWDKPFIQGGLK